MEQGKNSYEAVRPMVSGGAEGRRGQGRAEVSAGRGGAMGPEARGVTRGSSELGGADGLVNQACQSRLVLLTSSTHSTKVAKSPFGPSAQRQMTNILETVKNYTPT